MRPNQRTMCLYRDLGYRVWMVEKFNAHTKQRIDLYNCIDVLAIRGDETVGLQSCGASGDAAAHVRKILSNPLAVEWMEGANRKLIVVAWRKTGDRGKRKLWRARVIELDSLGGRSETEMRMPKTPRAAESPKS